MSDEQTVRDRIIQVAYTEMWMAQDFGKPTPEQLDKYFRASGLFSSYAAADQHSKDNWCGFFAVYCLRTAGLSTARWVSGLGISGPAKKVWGYNGVQKGDPVVFAHQSHHMLVAEVGNGWARLIGGNSDPPPDKRYVGGVIAVTSCPVQSFTAHYRLVIA